MPTAIILAAGRGSRMLQHTENKPKCLLEVNGTSLLERQISVFRANGVNQILVIRGYMGEAIPALSRVTFIENQRWQETNMVATLIMAAGWLRRHECIVSYGDIFYSSTTLYRLLNVDADIAITYDPNWLNLWQKRFADPLSDAETFRIDSTGRLLDIGDKTDDLEEIEGQYMGLLKFRPSGWGIVEEYIDRLPQRKADQLDMTSLLNILLTNNHFVQTVPCIGAWGEIDREHDLLVSEEVITMAEASRV